MVFERAEITITNGCEADFEKALSASLPLLRSDGGAHSVTWGRGVEKPSTYLLIVEWDSAEHHAKFTKSDAFGKFAAGVGSFFAGKPSVAHFEMLG